MDGDSLPVSAFVDHADGTFELGASAYEKRGVAVSVPEVGCREVRTVQPVRVRLPARYHPSLCSDRGRGSSRSRTDAKLADIKAGKGKGEYKFTMAVSPLDCMGCGVCVSAVRRPTRIEMVPHGEPGWSSRMSSTTCVEQGFRQARDVQARQRQVQPVQAAATSSSPAPAQAAPKPAMPAS